MFRLSVYRHHVVLSLDADRGHTTRMPSINLFWIRLVALWLGSDRHTRETCSVSLSLSLSLFSLSHTHTLSVYRLLATFW